MNASPKPLPGSMRTTTLAADVHLTLALPGPSHWSDFKEHGAVKQQLQD